MLTLEGYRTLSTLMIGATVEPKRWDDVLETLSRLTGDTATHIVGHDLTASHFLGAHYHGIDPDYATSFIEYYHRLNPWIDHSRRENVGEVIASHRICPDDELQKTEIYNDWIAPQEDILGGGGVLIERSGTRVFKIGGSIRRRDREEVEDGFLAALGMLVGPLSHAWEVGRAMSRTAILCANGIGDTSEAALLVLDDTGVPIFADNQAERLQTDGAILRATATGKVRFTDAAAQETLETALAGLGQGRAVTLKRRVGHGDTERILSLSSVLKDTIAGGVAGTVLGNGAPCLALVLSRATAQPDTDVLRRAYRWGLTPAEAQVAVALSRGEPIRCISVQRSVSIHTVRNQIKSAMAKCCVSSQSQLVALLAQP